MEGDVGGGGGRGDEECDEGAGKVAEGGEEEAVKTARQHQRRAMIEPS